MKTNPTPQDHPLSFLGIDVGKADLFCHLISPQKTLSARFDNDKTGIKALTKWLAAEAKNHRLIACLEQTGHYGDDIAIVLHSLPSITPHLVNPQRIKSYGMQKLRRNKSDTADAKLIAQFIKSEHADLRPWQPRSLVQQEITGLSRYADSLTQDTARLKTMLESKPKKSLSHHSSDGSLLHKKSSLLCANRSINSSSKTPT